MLLEKDINAELEHSEFIRQCYSRLLSLLPSRANRTKPTNYLGQFMLDQIDYYILNMEQFYNEMRIWEAYKLTKTFFRDIVEEIFLQPVRRRIITYPNSQEHPEHFYVMERLLSVLPVLTPLIPFTAYFISGQRQLAWPQIEDKMCVDRVGHHN